MRYFPGYVAILSITMAVFAVAHADSQSTIGQYILEANHVFTVYEDNKPVYCAGVGRGTMFKFSDPGDQSDEIIFIEIVRYPENQREDTENRYIPTCTGGVLEFLKEKMINYPFNVDIPSRMYREAGLRVAFGTLTIPFRYLLSPGEFVPGSTIGGYLGGQYAIYPDMAIIFGGSAGYGQIAFEGDAHSSFALAAFIGIKIGSAFHGGVVVEWTWLATAIVSAASRGFPFPLVPIYCRHSLVLDHRVMWSFNLAPLCK